MFPIAGEHEGRCQGLDCHVAKLQDVSKDADVIEARKQLEALGIQS